MMNSSFFKNQLVLNLLNWSPNLIATSDLSFEEIFADELEFLLDHDEDALIDEENANEWILDMKGVNPWIFVENKAQKEKKEAEEGQE